MTVVEAGLAAKSVAGALAMMALQGTVLALLALVLVRGGKLRPAWQAAVWLVVLVKFVLPWGPALPFSLADVMSSLQGSAPASAPLSIGPMPLDAAPQAVSIAPAIGWLALVAAWFTGTAIVIVRALVAGHRTARAARAATPAPADAVALLRELAARVRVRAPRLVLGDPAVGPHVVGLFRPVISAPPSLLANPTLLRAALLHELAHVRRRDAIGGVIQLAATAVFWFWPVVRLASRKLELARESACDAWALEAGEVSRPAYARLLVQMTQLRAPASALAAPHALDKRVAYVLGPTIRPRLGFVHRLALLGWIALALGGARTATAREPEAIVCTYSPELAEALAAAHPEADVDGDGRLSRDEACDFQAEVRKSFPVSTRLEPTAGLLAEPLCCNCDAAEGLSAPAPLSEASCQRDEGVVR
jgi:beta-lactamase regulating signal transducer with metallopeptidase domain